MPSVRGTSGSGAAVTAGAASGVAGVAANAAGAAGAGGVTDAASGLGARQAAMGRRGSVELTKSEEDLFNEGQINRSNVFICDSALWDRTA